MEVCTFWGEFVQTNLWLLPAPLGFLRMPLHIRKQDLNNHKNLMRNICGTTKADSSPSNSTHSEQQRHFLTQYEVSEFSKNSECVCCVCNKYKYLSNKTSIPVCPILRYAACYLTPAAKPDIYNPDLNYTDRTVYVMNQMSTQSNCITTDLLHTQQTVCNLTEP
jgi:hypothetical protein